MESSEKKKSNNVCAVATCPNPKGLTYHRFPKDENLSKLWKNLCKRRDQINVKNARICELHFEEKDYERDLRNELLNQPLRKILKSGKSCLNRVEQCLLKAYFDSIKTYETIYTSQDLSHVYQS